VPCHRNNRHIHVLSIVAVVVLAMVGAVAGMVAGGSVRQNDRILLKQEAGQVAIVLGSYVGQIGPAYSSLSTLIGERGPTSPGIAQAVTGIAKATGASVAVLQQSGPGHVAVVVSAGQTHAVADFDHNADVAAAIAGGKTTFVAVGRGGGKQWLAQVISGSPLPAGYAVYDETPITPYLPLSSIPGIPFAGVDVAIYYGAESSTHLVMATTRHLPLSGERAVTNVGSTDSLSAAATLNARPGSASSPHQLLVVMHATRHLSGSLSSFLPWILFGSGLLCALLVGIALEILFRRRDDALALVDSLQAKNAELDLAYQRQAEAEASLHQAQRMESVGQLAGGIAHDFNNLIHVILSYTGFLADSLEPGSRQRDDLAEIQRAARRAADLTRQLLAFSRRDTVEPSVVDLNHLVLQAEPLLRHGLGEDVALTCRVDPTPCTIRADAGQMDQVLMNLALNARDAMPLGGSVTISVRVTKFDGGKPGTDDTDGLCVRLEVTDNGTGMTPEVAARAFDPFFTTKDTSRGTGLGLSTVYGIVARWEGQASISTAPGVGTTVSLVFPLCPEEAQQPEEPRGAGVSPNGTETVLLVEDEGGVRRSTTRVLENAGYRVIPAEDASIAQEVFDVQAIDVLLTDVVMPGGISGPELADRLRLRKPELPVIFVSGYSPETMVERGVLPPMTALIEKPFTAELLLTTLRQFLPGHVRVPELTHAEVTP
jgi:signal transduction histidine kinase/CheY-like chemotaxis protein